MHTSFHLRLAALVTLALSGFGYSDSAIAAPLFGQQEVNQNQFAVIASPYGGNAHQLLIVEQISNVRPCWSESSSGTGVTTINPLLAEFDFTDICGRSTDSNGYSVRVGGEDLNWRYSLQAVKQNNDILLMAVPNVDRSAPRLVVGRTRGYTPGFAKFNLEPGWRIAKRSYAGSTIGHMYLTNDRTLASLNSAAIAAAPPTSTPISNTPVSRPPVSSTPVAAPVVSRPPLPITPLPRPVVPTYPVAAEQPKPQPVQRSRSSWWTRIFNPTRKATANPTNPANSPQVREVAAPNSMPTSGNTAPGNYVVPTVPMGQP